MRSSRLTSLLYWTLLVLMVSQSGWWVFYLSREGDRYLELQNERFQADCLHAAFLMRSDPAVEADPQGALGESFPHLTFTRAGNETQIGVDPAALREAEREARRRGVMFLSEGIFFLALLLAGSVLLTLAYRREQSFRRTRELFLAGVSHEFRTPLASLKLYAETLEREDLGQEDRRQIIASMDEDVSRLDAMVAQVMAVSRSEGAGGLAFERLDLAEEIREVLRSQEAFFRRERASWHEELEEDCFIAGDRGELALALRNLLQNAVRYSEAPAEVRVTLMGGRDWHRLAIADRGPGIPRSERKKIFRSFYRIGEAGGRPRGAHGSGLGLYLVKRAAGSLGGRVELESRPGEGSVFTLVLPAQGEES